jgi:hypothetical protein
MTRVTPLASGGGVAMFITRRPELTSGHREAAEWRRPGAGVGVTTCCTSKAAGPPTKKREVRSDFIARNNSRMMRLVY